MTYEDALATYGTVTAAAAAMAVPRTTFHSRLLAERARGHAAPNETQPLILPSFPDKNVPVGQLIERLAEESAIKKRRADAEKWFQVHIPSRDPIGVLWFGDPHLGTSTAWEQLNQHVAICNATPGMYGANIGDTTNNWVGSLMRLAAEEDISRESERRLARWFLAESGVTWLLWIFGNHDVWHEGAEIMRLMDIHNRVPMMDWSAKFELHFPDARPVRIHAAHDFPGHSMWNNTHAPSRAPRMLGDRADLYVCGHRHTWGIQQYEMPEADLSPLAIRVRGYKRGDSYAKRHGYPEDKHGSAVLTIINPVADGPGRILAFADIEQGARVLTALRAPKNVPRKSAPTKRKSHAKAPARKTKAKRPTIARLDIRKGGRRRH